MARGGFSLIEILVALAILAIAGMALMSSVQQSTRGARILEARSLVTLAAENILNTELADVSAPAFRSDRGRYDMAGQSYSWQMTVIPTGDPGLVRIQLNVEGEDSTTHQITTFRRAG